MEWLGIIKGDANTSNPQELIRALLLHLRDNSRERGLQANVEENCLYAVKGDMTIEACFEKVDHEVAGSIHVHAPQAGFAHKLYLTLRGLALLSLLTALGGFVIALSVRFLRLLSYENQFLFAQIGYWGIVSFVITIAFFGLIGVTSSSQMKLGEELDAMLAALRNFIKEKRLYLDESKLKT